MGGGGESGDLREDIDVPGHEPFLSFLVGKGRRRRQTGEHKARHSLLFCCSQAVDINSSFDY